MLAIQSNIAKYHCLYMQGAVAFQTPSVFLTHPVVLYNTYYTVQFSNINKMLYAFKSILHCKAQKVSSGL